MVRLEEFPLGSQPAMDTPNIDESRLNLFSVRRKLLLSPQAVQAGLEFLPLSVAQCEPVQGSSRFCQQTSE
jgi:hypothetical protein